MNNTLYALFLEVDGEFEFYLYFWDARYAFLHAEAAPILICKDITDYKIETHRILIDFDYSNEKFYEKPADKYEIVGHF